MKSKALTKPGPKSTTDAADLLVFGAHPDDIEFGCGGVIAAETARGRRTRFAVCSHGEAGSFGTPKQRTAEARKAAALLGATIEFVELDGDSHLELRAAHAIGLAAVIRRVRPEYVFAPSLVQNQHPDHWRLGLLVRDATRLAFYGGVKELIRWPRHLIRKLFFYAVTPEAEPPDVTPLLIDVSAPKTFAAWTAAMNTHASQTSAREYVELQLARARYHGLRSGATHAIPLFPNEPVMVNSLYDINNCG